MSNIILYLGARGSGKTLSMVKDAYIEYKRGRRVITNMEDVSFGEHLSNDEIKKLTKESDLYDAVLLIDEAQIFFDSRRSMKKENLNFSYFVLQTRKRNIDIYFTTQFSNTIDRRIRDNIDYVAYPHYISDYYVCEVEYIDNTSLEDPYLIEPKKSKVFFNALQVFSLYDTNETI